MLSCNHRVGLDYYVSGAYLQTDVLEKEVPKAQALTQVPTIYWQAYGSAAQEAGIVCLNYLTNCFFDLSL